MSHAIEFPVTGMETAPRALALCAAMDLTDFPRVGARGARTCPVLADAGYVLPPVPNQACVQEGGELLARLSATEFLLLSEPGRHVRAAHGFSGDGLRDAERFFRLERLDSHAWVRLAGIRCAEVMAKMCSVDLREENFSAGSVAQTSVARINATVIREPLGRHDGLHIVFDRSYLRYIKESLLDAMQEFNGTFVDPIRVFEKGMAAA